MTEPKHPHHFHRIGALAQIVTHKSALRMIATGLDAAANGDSEGIARADHGCKAAGLTWSDLRRDRRAK
ncbi:MAG: hypothetical protein RIC87_12470 [Kiloniellales bacterium]